LPFDSAEARSVSAYLFLSIGLGLYLRMVADVDQPSLLVDLARGLDFQGITFWLNHFLFNIIRAVFL
jgi:hypothetical protein